MTQAIPPTHVSGVPLGSRAGRRLKAGEGGAAQRLAYRLRRIPSLLVSWLVADALVIVLAIVMIGLGFFVTKVLLSIGPVVTADEWLPIWFEGQRTAFLDDASYVASLLADRPVVIPLIGVVGLFLGVRRRWRMASFVLQAALAEVLCYALIVHFVTRQRPPVEQLDTFNLTHSFPSGHVAASVAIYGALALLLAAHFKDIRVRVTIWCVAAIFPLLVMASRIYRGEHHPIDVIAGALMGAAALAIALFAGRTALRVAQLRKERHAAEAGNALVELPGETPAPVEVPA